MIPAALRNAPEVVSVQHWDEVPGVTANWPSWLPGTAIDALRAAGIEAPWRHQVELAELAHAGEHCAVTTPTASGKTLAYVLPLLAARHEVREPTNNSRHLRSATRGTALYLSPTKALAHDQLRTSKRLGEATWRIGALDGDSADGERRFARDFAEYVLSNPDMLHHAVLPNHGRWASFLGGLRYVIIDEAHRYRGTFGAHVAQVLRRLRRICGHYGAHPTFIFASATAPNAAHFCGELISEDSVRVVSESTAPRPARDVVLWQPSTTATADSARLLANLVDSGRQTIAFVASRNLAEVIAARASDQSSSGRLISSYRGGYLAHDRRDIEAALQSGEVTGVAATNALELGVDISGMDAVIVHGFPGTVASMWQQLGRAGRSDTETLGVLIAKDDPLDAFLFDHPELLFGDTVEKQIVHPENPYVLGPHLAAAAQEAPLTATDERWFGTTLVPLADHLVAQGVLRKRPAGWYWTRPDKAASFINLRTASGAGLDIIERQTGRVLGTVDPAAADKAVHLGAVYLHQGEQYLVVDYDPDQSQALVVAARPRYYTQALSTFDVRITAITRQRPLGKAVIHTGQISLTSQVVGYLRRDEETGKVWDQTPLELPPHTFATQATWWTLPPAVIAEAGINAALVGSAAHAMEHCAIGLLPAFAPCDRWDIGGVSMAMHPDTGQATVFVHDGLPGGSGFAEAGYDIADQWLRATLSRLDSCTCEAGCPACVVSPKCGNANQLLDRHAATRLLRAVLSSP